MTAEKITETPTTTSVMSLSGQRKINIDIGYLLCAFSLLIMGILSIVAQSTDGVPSIFNLSAFGTFSPPALRFRTFLLLGLFPFIVSLVFFAGVMITTIKCRTPAHIAASVLALPFLVTTFFTFIMVGFIHTEADVFNAMVRWSPMRSPNSFLVRSLFVFQIMFILANAILLLIPVIKKGIVYKILLGVVFVLNIKGLLILSSIDTVTIYLLLIGMWYYIILGANYFGITHMAIVLPVITGIALGCGGFIKPETQEVPLEESPQVDERVDSEEAVESNEVK